MRIKKRLLVALLFLGLSASVTSEADPFGNLFLSTTSGGGSSCSYTPPLDANAAVAAYSFRLLRTAYSGGNIVTIKRSSDNTSKTFTLTVPNCSINPSDPFFDSSTYTITTWYDQSGNGNNLTVASGGSAATVTLNCKNSQPCAVFNGSSTKYSGTLASAVSNTTHAVVVNTNSTSYQGVAFLGSGSNETAFGFLNPTPSCIANRASSGTNYTATEACAINTWYRTISTLNGTLSRIYVNGTQGTDVTTSGTISSLTSLTLGWDPGGFGYMSGDVAEWLLFAPDLSTANSNIVTANQGSYWGI